MSKFGWDLDKLEREKKLAFINVSPVRVAPTEKAGLIQLGMKEFKLIKLLEAIRTGVKEIQAKRVVIDPITIFTLQYPDEVERIYAMRDLIADFRKTGCTNLLISELRGTGLEREHQFEEYLAQGEPHPKIRYSVFGCPRAPFTLRCASRDWHSHLVYSVRGAKCCT